MKNKKGFTLIELIVIVAVIAILVTIGLPRYLGHTKDATETKLKHDAKLIQDASERYYMNNNNWPYLLDENNNPVKAGNNGDFEILYKVEPFDDNNENVIFYEIDFDKLKPYVKIKSNSAYFVAAVGNPDFGITALNPKDKTTQERITNPINPDPLRQPETDETIINSAKDLDNIRNNLNGNYILMSNIDLSEYENWIPIGDNDNRFTGSLDGNGFKITNLKINRTANYTGLFGYTGSGAKLSNIALENVNIKGRTHTGGLVGQNDSGTITNSYSTGTVSGGSYTGGLVGITGGTITNSYSTGTVSGLNRVGGLVGSNQRNTLENSYSTATVTGTDMIGGLAGDNWGIITNSRSTGTVSGRDYTGGLVGYNSYGTITNSYSTGTVTGTTKTGGMAGYSQGNIINSYSTGTVSGKDHTGGLVGHFVRSNNFGSIVNSYSTGIVSGTGSYTGGLVGYRRYSTPTNSYWNTETSGQSTSDGGTGLTTEQMKQRLTYTDWDFDTIWQIEEGKSYPYLRTNPQSPPPQ